MTRSAKAKNTVAPVGGAKPAPVAYIVSGAGADDEIRARCAEAVEGWDRLDAGAQVEMVGLMRSYHAMPAPARMSITEHGIDSPQDGNATLHLLRQAKAMASPSHAYLDMRTAELTAMAQATVGVANSTKLNADLALIDGANATDTVQSTLLVQMVATHDAALKALRLMATAQTTEMAKLYATLAPKLLNAYTRQCEVLAKLQRGGEQIIKHVHIDNRHGGQAVVADTFVKGGQPSEIGDQCHGAAAIEAGAAMLGYDPARNGMPIAGREGEATVQDARWHESRRAQG